MYIRTIAATALSLMMVSGAVAQSGGSKDLTNVQAPENWGPEIRGTFWTGNGTMLSKEEIAQGWQKLTPDQQTMVREDCRREAYNPTSRDNTDVGADAPTDPVPGVVNMTAACDLVGTL